MKKTRIIYTISAILLNIALAFPGFWVLIIGLLIASGPWFGEPTLKEELTGYGIVLACIYGVALLNFGLFLIFRKKAEFKIKWFVIPVGSLMGAVLVLTGFLIIWN